MLDMSGNYQYPVGTPPEDAIHPNETAYDVTPLDEHPPYGQDHAPINLALVDRPIYDPNFTSYEQPFANFQGFPTPATPQEGFAFWYRPEPQETIYQHDSQMYNNVVPMQSTPVTMAEPPPSKHRRTRSGCFTCRGRRVKCDEQRPICDRCRKGNRECEFPATASSTKRAKLSESKSTAGDSAPDPRLETIVDESDDEEFEEEEERANMPPQNQASKSSTLSRTRTQSLSGSTRPHKTRQQSNTSVTVNESSAVSSTNTPTLNTPQSPVLHPKIQHLQTYWKQLKPDLKPEMEKYLTYQHEHMTFLFYLFKLDPDDFFHGEFIDLALNFEPLLYAVVAFAAYHHTVRLPDSQAEFHAFWKYYCKSIVKLRRFLESTDERHDAVLLTILQLATFEEYLGDWTNLASHHRAAYGILVSKHTPQSIMSTERGRKIFEWYVRLDVISGLMAVRDVSLDRSWVDYAMQWYQERIQSSVGNPLHNKLEYFGKQVSKIGHDIAHTFASANELLEQGRFSIDSVLKQADQLAEQLDQMRRNIQELNDPALSGVDSEPSSRDGDVFTARTPLFREELWPLNYVWIDWYGLQIMLKNQVMLAVRKAGQVALENSLTTDEIPTDLQERVMSILTELTRDAKLQCQIHNAIDRSPSAPAGATLVCYASFALSTVFLPRAPPDTNARYTTWARRQLAKIELQGYIWPPHFRKEIANLLQDPSIEEWWLPNNENKPRILGEIRMVVDDRIAAVTGNGKDDGRNDLREIKGIFERMDLNPGRRRSSLVLDPAYVNSSAGMAHAASLVSTPEEGSSTTESVVGLSPRQSVGEIDRGKSNQRSKNANRGGLIESPLMQSQSANETSKDGMQAYQAP